MKLLPKLLTATAATAALVGGIQGNAFAVEYLYGYGGHAEWQADPEDGDPGDSFKACDDSADGWGVWVTLDYEGSHREATTQGHPMGYCTPWVSGNIPEGTTVTIWVWEIQSNGDGTVDLRNGYSFERKA